MPKTLVARISRHAGFSAAAIQLVAALAVIAMLVARAADPLAYTVAIKPTGQGALDETIRQSSSLIALRDKSPVGPFALIARARADVTRFQAALQSQGYYKAQVKITVLGRDLEDPGLLAMLETLAAKQKVPVVVAITTGPMFHLGKIEIVGNVTQAERDALGLKSGQNAVAAEVLAGQGKLLKALKHDGHAFAKVAPPEAIEHDDTDTIDVSFRADPGPRVDLGPIALEGLHQVNPAYPRGLITLKPGMPYDADQIEQQRLTLAGLPVFAGVQAETPDQLDANGQLPLDFKFAEAPRHAISFNGSYSTDLGADLTASWTDRNVFGHGETLTLSASADEIGGLDAQYPGYDLSATYAIPQWQRPDQTLSFNISALQQYLYTYTQAALYATSTLTRQLTPQLSANIGLGLEQELITQNNTSALYTLFSTPVGLKFDNTNNPLEPTRGFRATAQVTPTASLGGFDGHALFVIGQSQASTYLDLSGDGRTVLALRGMVGDTLGATELQVPADQRFYGGGSANIRGYRYQWASPQFADQLPAGGLAMDAGTIELRQRIASNWGTAAFFDVGQVSEQPAPFTGQTYPGVGVGLRYFTGFGPVRVDFAIPLVQVPGDFPFEIYVGLGEAF
jgi:translocation and assembly module TamA